jgi:hypothetical protein
MIQCRINPGTAFKLGGLGDGPRLSCMNLVWLELAIMIVFTENNLSLGNGFLRSMVKRSKFGTSLGASCFGPFGVNATTTCSTTNDGMSLRSST